MEFRLVFLALVAFLGISGVSIGVAFRRCKQVKVGELVYENHLLLFQTSTYILFLSNFNIYSHVT
ncbi:hypothetical protein [Lysinibacillus sp. ZYM-1]|uniref:hypothetical protein n=1 Tax=Lysinibacillus sp. ZYM-1 TaxID=1681184 RepID=UPI0006CE7DB2|nr:hypothetical protein [Lysinibacillus sp. ZYM-1]KPN94803.1 hypothetical protein AO843_04700 [Lysinibacillus sp. ZYM-1]